MNVKDLEMRDEYSPYTRNTIASPGPCVSIMDVNNTYKIKLNTDGFLRGTKTRISDRFTIKMTLSIGK